MLVTINDIIESALNPTGRFGALEGIYFRVDSVGMPLMRLMRDNVVLEAVYGGVEYLLTVPLKGGAISIDDCESAAPYIVPATIFPREMLVLSLAGEEIYLDVVLQAKPTGRCLTSVVDGSAGRLTRGELRKLFEGLCGLCLWACGNQCVSRRIKISDIFVTESGDEYSLQLAGYLSGYRKRIHGELLSAVLVMFLFSVEQDFYREFTEKYSFRHVNIRKYLGALRDIGIPALQPFFSLLPFALSLDNGSGSAEFVAENVRRLMEMQGSESLSFGRRPQPVGSGVGNKWDFAGYDWVGPLSDDLICVRKHGKWGYLTDTGDLAFDKWFTEADDFNGGRAVVHTSKGYGLIDTSGDYVVPAINDDLCWDAEDSVARVMRDGFFALFDRQGRDLTGFGYDMIEGASGGLMLAQREGMYGFLAPDGKTVIEFIYNEAYSFQDDMALVDYEGETYYIDTAGNRLA